MTGERTLETVREEIDVIDDAIHDLIMRRTALVEEVREIKRDWPIKIQTAREAEIVYRLFDRHRGPFPKRELYVIWRQLIVATLSFEGPFSVAASVADGDESCWHLARDHFGAFTRIDRCGLPAEVLDRVARQDAVVGVVPLPGEGPDPGWWTRLPAAAPQPPRIVARLPFVGPSNAVAADRGALALAPVAVSPSGRDRAYVVARAERPPTIERLAAALARAGLPPVATAGWRSDDGGGWSALAEIDGFVATDDDRLARSASLLPEAGLRLLTLGGYARPLAPEELTAEVPLHAAPAPPDRPRSAGAAVR
jgi:chorismate mutase